MITGIDVNELHEYVSPNDKNKEKPTTFILGTLTNRQKLKMVGSAMTSDGKFEIEKLQDKAVDIVKAGLKGINGISNTKGEVIDIKEITDDVIDMLPVNIIIELVGEILKINFLQENEQKN